MYIRDCARRERGHLGGVERIEVARENRRRRKISAAAAAAGLTNKAKKWSMARGQVYVCVCVLTCLFFPIFLFLSNTHTRRACIFFPNGLSCLFVDVVCYAFAACPKTDLCKRYPVPFVGCARLVFFLITVIASCCCRSRLFGVRLCPTATKLRELSVRPCPRESRSPQSG